MNNQKNFRVINKTEKKIIVDSLSKISSKIFSIINDIEYELFISFNILSSKNQFPSIYLIPNNLKHTLDNIELKININSAGIYFGFIKRNQFFLSLEGAEFLYKLSSFSEGNYIYVNNHGEKSILYGNKILKEMIVKISPNLKKRDFLLVFNQSSELISIAQSEVDYIWIQNLNHENIVALNLVDRGYYLRKKQ